MSMVTDNKCLDISRNGARFSVSGIILKPESRFLRALQSDLCLRDNLPEYKVICTMLSLLSTTPTHYQEKTGSRLLYLE